MVLRSLKCGNSENCFLSISLHSVNREIPEKAGLLLEPLGTNKNPSELLSGCLKTEKTEVPKK